MQQALASENVAGETILQVNILQFDSDFLVLVCDRFVDLGERGSRYRFVVELLKYLARQLAKLLLEEKIDLNIFRTKIIESF